VVTIVKVAVRGLPLGLTRDEKVLVIGGAGSMRSKKVYLELLTCIRCG
jgi:hypothetical protein